MARRPLTRLHLPAALGLPRHEPGAVDDIRRRLKPGIPLTGDDGIPRRDELELERLLGRGSSSTG